MHPTLRRLIRTASFRGGFTLVELLVVIGIIAILAGVALGPITSGLKKAQQNAAVQQSHALGMAMFAFAGDNGQTYPDTNNPSGNAGTSGAGKVAYALLNGGYVSDATQFWMSGGTATKFAGTASAAASTITSSNISFDFVSAGGPATGLSTTVAQYEPLLWNSISAGSEPTLSGTSAITVTNLPNGNAFGQTGMAVFYCNESANFVTAVGGTVTLVTTAQNAGTAPSTVTATALEGGD
jgi:prepilin-type N-terminal cleavage/methylation domain-containing protein